MVKKIMFLCKHNSFRSKVAESIFYKKYKGKNYNIISRGIFPGPFIYPSTRKYVKKSGYDIYGKPRGATFNEIKSMDKIILIANDIPKEILTNYNFMKGKVILWKIPDTSVNDADKIIQIEKKVIKFIGKLG